MLNWISRNVYTIAHKNVRLKILIVVETYNSLKKVSHKKKGTPRRTWGNLWMTENLFDKKYADLTWIKEQERIRKVKQKAEDTEFYKHNV